MERANTAATKLVCLVLMLVCMMPMVGCVGLVANLLNVMGAGMMPAAFEGLEGKKVAVVCVSNSELFGPTSTSSELANRINRLLATKVKHIEIVPQQSIEDWIDRNNWDMIDFVTIGRGVEAEVVVAVDIDSLSLHDGATMFKGRSDIHVVVYDVKQGNEVFSRSPPQIEFPTTTGVPATSISEKEFKKLFLNAVAGRIARNFYAFDMNEDVAIDTKTIGSI